MAPEHNDESEESRAADSAPSVPLSQENIDALLSANTDVSLRREARSVPDEELETLSGDEVEALINQSSALGASESSSETTAPPHPGPATAPPETPPQGADPPREIDAPTLDRILGVDVPDVGASGGEPSASPESLDEALTSADTPLDGADPDALIEPAPLPQEIPLTGAAPVTGTPPSEQVARRQAAIDALARSPAPPVSPEDVSAENLAAASPPEEPGDSIPQSLLESIIEEAASEPETTGIPAVLEEPSPIAATGEEAVAAPEPEVAEAAGIKAAARRIRRRPRRPGAFTRLIRAHPLQLSASIAAALISGFATFVFLYTNQTIRATPERLAAFSGANLDAALRAAENLIEQGRNTQAIAALRTAIAEAQPGPSLIDARFTLLDAQMRILGPKTSPDDGEELHAEIADLLETAAAHPRAPEAVFWQGILYERDGIPLAARDAYLKILDEYPQAPNRDRALLNAGRLALHMQRGEEAASHFRRLLEEFPASPLAPEAKLWLGDAYLLTGDKEAARRVYRQVAVAEAGRRLAGEAYARLGRAAFDEGNHQEAIAIFNEYIQTATITEGIDTIYLLLAQAYRASGQLALAEQTLRDLIDFFPETPSAPKAYIELSRILDSLGQRRDAIRIAVQAQQLFDKNPAVHEWAGDLYALNGEPRAAADAYLSAASVGVADPATLLKAGEQFQLAGELSSAYETYRTVMFEFPSSPQATTASVEAARVLYQLGQKQEALRRLEDLRLLTAGQPQHAATLLALGELYQDAQLTGAAAQAFQELATISNEPATLARAALALLTAGKTDLGLQVASRVRPDQLSGALPYELLTRQGQALLPMDKDRGIALLEEAHTNYPGERTAEGEMALLTAYLNTGLTQRARALIADIAAKVRSNPIEAPRLRAAAERYANYLYERRDYRAAADAYAIVTGALGASNYDVGWAQFQQANALFQSGAIQESVTLLDKLAASNSEWAENAKIRAEYIRLEQRMRGNPLPAVTARADGAS